MASNGFSIGRGFWGHHKRKILIGLGAIGGGYVIYKIWDLHKQNTIHLDRQLEREKQEEELLKLQIKSHFENIQKISDTTTLPHVMRKLRSKIVEQLDLSELRDKLVQGKRQPGTMSPEERVQIWDRLKILNFTRTTAALWAVTMLSLYVRVQVNILGRHLYLDIARNADGDSESPSHHGLLEFLSTADYLPTHGINNLLRNMETACTEVLKEKQLTEKLSMEELGEMVTKILDVFMKMEGPGYWVSYLVPQNASIYRKMAVSSTSEESSQLMDASKLEQLMSQTRAILSSSDFGEIMEMAMRNVVKQLIEEMSSQISGTDPRALARLLPNISQMCIMLLEEPDNNEFISNLCNNEEIELFYTLVYADIPFES